MVKILEVSTNVETYRSEARNLDVTAGDAQVGVADCATAATVCQGNAR